MAKTYALKAASRDRAGKGVARSLRREGKTPAVIYGDKKEPVKITLDQNEINVEYRRGLMYTTLCDLQVDGSDKHLVLARDVQLHPVTDVVEHVDFMRVTKKTKISVMVPVNLINEEKSPGLLNKGVLNVVRHEVELMCSAMAIPDSIDVNLEGKEIGDSVNISDASLPEGVKPVIDDRDFTIATLIAPKTAEELEAELEGDAEEGEEGAEGAEGEEGEEGAESEEGKEDEKSEG